MAKGKWKREIGSYFTFGYTLYTANFCLSEICNLLTPVQHKWLVIGIQLGVPHYYLEGLIKEDHSLALVAVISYWLKGNIQGATPGWQSLEIALKSRQVDEPGLAGDIHKKDCQQKNSITEDEGELLTNYHNFATNLSLKDFSREFSEVSTARVFAFLTLRRC